jgi:hypothetical protein
MTKKEMVENKDSCLNKAADNEPLFVLRAQDMLAPQFVNAWANSLEQYCVQKNKPVPAKVADAYEIANQMRAWPNRKYPD